MSFKERRLENVLIVGAGLAGLTLAIGLRRSGFSVIVLERTPRLQEIGAGIQLPANSSRTLSSLGVLETVREYSEYPQSCIVQSYSGTHLHTQPLNPWMEHADGSEHLLIHRADLRRVLYDAAIAAGATVRFDAAVVRVDSSAGIVHMAGGETQGADLIVGADGERSVCREALLGKKNPPRSSGDLVYRVSVPLSRMQSEPELATLYSPPAVLAWYGPNSHAVCYKLKKDGIFNMVLTLPEVEGAATIGPQPADLGAIREAFKDWDPRLVRVLWLAESALKWTLLETDTLSTWCNEQGNFILIGDSAHATLPYLAQGASIALESAQMLSDMLAIRPLMGELPSLLKAYVLNRQPRVQMTRNRSKQMHDMCQMEDGPEQIERDRVLMKEKPGDGFPNPWADPGWQASTWGFNTKLEAQKCLDKWVREVRDKGILQTRSRLYVSKI